MTPEEIRNMLYEPRLSPNARQEFLDDIYRENTAQLAEANIAHEGIREELQQLKTAISLAMHPQSPFIRAIRGLSVEGGPIPEAERKPHAEYIDSSVLSGSRFAHIQMLIALLVILRDSDNKPMDIHLWAKKFFPSDAVPSEVIEKCTRLANIRPAPIVGKGVEPFASVIMAIDICLRCLRAEAQLAEVQR